MIPEMELALVGGSRGVIRAESDRDIPESSMDITF